MVTVCNLPLLCVCVRVYVSITCTCGSTLLWHGRRGQGTTCGVSSPWVLQGSNTGHQTLSHLQWLSFLADTHGNAALSHSTQQRYTDFTVRSYGKLQYKTKTSLPFTKGEGGPTEWIQQQFQELTNLRWHPPTQRSLSQSYKDTRIAPANKLWPNPHLESSVKHFSFK